MMSLASNNAISLNLWESLNPDSVKIDGRDNRDRLAFMARYAELILYYSKDNKVAGNWQAFLVKDPVLLLALISKTDYSRFHIKFCKLYEKASLSLSHKPDSNKEDKEQAAEDELFPIILDLFLLVDRWLYFMNLDQREYSLKKFVVKKIEQRIAPLLWESLSLQQEMSKSSGGIISPPSYAFTETLQPVWKEVGPYRSLRHTTEGENQTNLNINSNLEKIQGIYLEVFSFVIQVIENAERDFYTLEKQKNDYPDTALLVVFSRLMDLTKKNINELSGKHLNFYYDKVLRQTPRSAIADEVYLCLKLTEKTPNYRLPENTEFIAGSYPDNSDIIFENIQGEDLNLAAVDCAYSELYLQPEQDLTGLYLDTVEKLDKIKTNQDGEVLSWNGFGSTKNTAVKTGFAMASPMFYLEGGHRTITLAFHFDEALPTNYFADAQVFLSTETEWHLVSMTLTQLSQVDPNNTLRYQIILKTDEPSIVPFVKNPDGYNSSWPLLKLVLGSSVNLCQSVKIQSIQITTSVKELSPQVAGNNVAPLPVGKSIQIFGAVPELGSYFYVGSAECFSKPLKKLELCQVWDNPKKDFHTYYEAYNKFLANGEIPVPWHFSNTAFKGVWAVRAGRQWQDLTSSQGALPDKHKISVAENDADSLPISKPNKEDDATDVQLFQQSQLDVSASTPSKKENLPVSIFEFTLTTFMLKPVPQLLLSGLPQVLDAGNGYLRFQLSSPTYAFGHDLYAKVVSALSLHNAQVLINQADGGLGPDIEKLLVKIANALENVFKKLSVGIEAVLGNLAKLIKGLINEIKLTANNADPDSTKNKKSSPDVTGLVNFPNLPFVPKASEVYLNYEAETTECYGENSDEYPSEFFHYGPLNTYSVYKSGESEQALAWKTLAPGVAVTKSSENQSIPLFTPVGGEASLFLGFKNVVTPGVLSLLVELAQDSFSPIIRRDDISWYFWGESGWQNIEPVYDKTQNLNCSGIVKFDFPEITGVGGFGYTSCPVIKGSDFWLVAVGKRAGLQLKIVYLNTQAVKLKRVNMTALSVGEFPKISAGAISATKQKTPQIEGVAQPFPSFSGVAAENDKSYLCRVSQRLGTKNRVSSQSNYESMAYDALASLYYVRQVVNQKKYDKRIRLGLIPRYPNVQHVNAFRPHMNACDMETIRLYIQSKVSALSQFLLFNFKHEKVQIVVTLQADIGTNSNELAKTVNQELKHFLSPWVKSSKPQTALATGIVRADLLHFIATINGVKQIESLSIKRENKIVSDDIVQPVKPDAILITDDKHVIKVASLTKTRLSRASSDEEVTGER